VQHTNFAQVCPVADPRGGRITAFGVIDNLGKGAAGQAVQNANHALGLPETSGLRLAGVLV
jgi:N-acetyl-gamma-glutamyl-phosphate reductase